MIDDLKITDVINCKIWKYVMPYDLNVDTWFGVVRLIRGRVWNGASGVPDLDYEASAVHDCLYAFPVIEGKRIAKVQCDIIYGQLLWIASENTKRRGTRWYNGVAYHFRKRYRKFAAFFRPLGLHFLGDPAWREHRLNERKLGEKYQEWMAQTYFVPRKGCWDFPSFHTKHAIWIGVRS